MSAAEQVPTVPLTGAAPAESEAVKPVSSEGHAHEEEQVQEMLDIVTEEKDMDDWLEVASGALMVTLGIWQLVSPSTAVFEASIVQFLGAVFAALGFALIGHGYKDMMVKETVEKIIRVSVYSEPQVSGEFVRIQCNSCGNIIVVTETKRPVEIKCAGCGSTGMLED